MFKVTHEALSAKCLKPTSGIALKVRLMMSDNEYLSYPVKGVIHIIEQGADLEPIVAVFHSLHDDGALGCPVEVRNPRFECETTLYPKQ